MIFYKPNIVNLCIGEDTTLASLLKARETLTLATIDANRVVKGTQQAVKIKSNREIIITESRDASER